MDNKKTFTKYFVIVLVVIGGLGVLGKLQDRVANEDTSDDGKTKTDFFEVNNVMSGNKKEYIFKEFKGGIINSVMGGIDIDLKSDSIKKGAVIDVVLLMGGAKIRVPKDWNVLLDTDNIMGGSHDQYVEEDGYAPDKNKTVKIKGTILMGGLEIHRF